VKTSTILNETIDITGTNVDNQSINEILIFSFSSSIFSSTYIISSSPFSSCKSLSLISCSFSLSSSRVVSFSLFSSSTSSLLSLQNVSFTESFFAALFSSSPPLLSSSSRLFLHSA
jgi:hypothetical protein